MPKGIYARKPWKLYRKVILEQEEEIRKAQSRIALQLDGIPLPSKQDEETDNILAIDEDDPERWLKTQTLKLYKAVIKSAMKGNANSQRLAAQLAGKLVEKTEVKVKLSAEEYYRIRDEARNRVNRAIGKRNGAGGLLASPGISAEELRVDNKQEHSQDS